jgi:hypothetical protein
VDAQTLLAATDSEALISVVMLQNVSVVNSHPSALQRSHRKP